MIDIKQIILTSGSILDSNWERGVGILLATPRQIRSVNIYLSTLAKANGLKKKKDIDTFRYRVVQDVTHNKYAQSTKVLTKGQASVFIYLQSKYPQQLEDYLTQHTKGTTNDCMG